MPESRVQVRARVRTHMNTIATVAVAYIGRVLREETVGTSNRIGIARFVIEHCLGKPVAQLEISDGSDNAVTGMLQFTELELRGMYQEAADRSRANAEKLERVLTETVIDSQMVEITPILKGAPAPARAREDNSDNNAETIDVDSVSEPAYIDNEMRLLWANSREQQTKNGERVAARIAADLYAATDAETNE